MTALERRERERGYPRRFAEVVQALDKEPGVAIGLPGAKKYGYTAMTVKGKIFAMLSSEGEFVVRLPKRRVDVLQAVGAGKMFDSGKRTPMKEWLQVHTGSGWSWLELAREALGFVRKEP